MTSYTPRRHITVHGFFAIYKDTRKTAKVVKLQCKSPRQMLIFHDKVW